MVITFGENKRREKSVSFLHTVRELVLGNVECLGSATKRGVEAAESEKNSRYPQDTLGRCHSVSRRVEQLDAK